jgi:hypothetical protein
MTSAELTGWLTAAVPRKWLAKGSPTRDRRKAPARDRAQISGRVFCAKSVELLENT